jgi:hypothetical protein
MPDFAIEARQLKTLHLAPPARLKQT